MKILVYVMLNNILSARAAVNYSCQKFTLLFIPSKVNIESECPRIFNTVISRLSDSAFVKNILFGQSAVNQNSRYLCNCLSL